MLAAALIVAGIALVDALDPAQIGSSIALAGSPRAPVRRLLEFAASHFVTNAALGVLIMLGPGHWLFSLLPHPSHHTKSVAAVAAGIVALAAAAAVRLGRRRLRRALPRQDRARSGSALLFGAGVALAELPTAFPYFAAIAAIEAAHLPLAEEVLLVALYCLVFLIPTLLMALLVGVSDTATERVIAPARRWLSGRWLEALVLILAVGGVALLVVGLAGLSS